MSAGYVFLLLIVLTNTLTQYVICGIAVSRITKNYKNPSNPVAILKSWESAALIFLLIADYILGFLFAFLNHRLAGGGNAEALLMALRAIGWYTILPYDLVIIVLTFYLLSASHKQRKGNTEDKL